MRYSAGLDTIIQEVKSEFKSMLIKRRQLVEKLGYAFEKEVVNPESVCEEIKSCLKEEIAEKIISSRAIEQYCLDKYRHNSNSDLRSDLVHFAGVKVQVKHMDHLFRVYIKKIGEDTFCRVEETKQLSDLESLGL